MQESEVTRIAVFASGDGSNAQEIFKYFARQRSVAVVLLLCNRLQAGVYKKAHDAGIATVYCPKSSFYDSNNLIKLLRTKCVDYIILSGFLLKIPTNLIETYPQRILNIHPSLLPKYGGAGMYGRHVHQAVANAKEKESGISIHVVTQEFDEGPILFQARCKLKEGDTAEDIQKRVQVLEHKYFAEQCYKYIQNHAY